jgi:hypothetical protein
MAHDKLIKLADYFYSLAKEKLPAKSEDTNTVLKNIESLENFNSRIEYAQDNLERLSSGSSRIVYLANDDTVIKLAKNEKGLSQNKAEAGIKIKSDYLNEVIAHADNNSWIQVNYVDKLTAKEFEEMTGLDFDEFAECIRYGLKHISGNTDKDKPKKLDKIKETKIYKEMKKIGNECNLMGGDLARISSYGKIDNHPILIDAGLTKEVFEKYYESSSSSSSESETGS